VITATLSFNRIIRLRVPSANSARTTRAISPIAPRILRFDSFSLYLNCFYPH
jgi:hypothetical protein